MSRRAREQNAFQRRASSEELVDQPVGSDALVQASQSLRSAHLSELLDFSIADDRYAIGEAIVDEARNQCPGWLQTKHEEFERLHGNMQCNQSSDADGDSLEFNGEEEDGKMCPSDLCARDAERMDNFTDWQTDLQQVLRVARNWRNVRGFVPDHPLIAVVSNEMTSLNDLESGQSCFLMARVQFRPYIGTLVKMCLTSRSVESSDEILWSARMELTAAGLPELRLLPGIWASNLQPGFWSLGVLVSLTICFIFRGSAPLHN